jgi:hypothetical protein
LRVPCESLATSTGEIETNAHGGDGRSSRAANVTDLPIEEPTTGHPVGAIATEEVDRAGEVARLGAQVAVTRRAAPATPVEEQDHRAGLVGHLSGPRKPVTDRLSGSLPQHDPDLGIR